jgi:hypothetical protein
VDLLSLYPMRVGVVLGLTVKITWSARETGLFHSLAYPGVSERSVPKLTERPTEREASASPHRGAGQRESSLGTFKGHKRSLLERLILELSPDNCSPAIIVAHGVGVGVGVGAGDGVAMISSRICNLDTSSTNSLPAVKGMFVFAIRFAYPRDPRHFHLPPSHGTGWNGCASPLPCTTPDIKQARA